MTVLNKIESEIFPKAVKEGRFGEDTVKFITFKNDFQLKPEDQYLSSVYYGDVVLKTNKGDEFTQSVVIKVRPKPGDPNASSSWAIQSDEVLFYNELLFYTKILPLLDKCDSTGTVIKMFPKLFYGSSSMDQGELDDILIFENVQKLGFKHAESKTFLDYNHVKLAIEWIARFHSLSLVCKRKYPGKLQEIAVKIKENRWTEERLTTKLDALFVENCKRGVLPLLDDPYYKDKLKDLLAVVEETDHSAAKIVVPVEPLAVICHGDFHRNNIFYKYNSEGVPCEIISFDFATVRYSSPVIDLSFLLFMNSSPEVRSSHWDNILETYHSALTSNPGLDPKDAPSLADLTTEFQRRGFYGYIVSSFWLPSMQMIEKGTCHEWWRESLEDKIRLSVLTGGEEGTCYVVEMVKHMIDKKYDFKFIKNLELKSIKKLSD